MNFFVPDFNIFSRIGLKLWRYGILLCCIVCLCSCGKRQAVGQEVKTKAVVQTSELDPARMIYSWNSSFVDTNALVNRIPVPDGYHRMEASPPSFSYWLRHIPLKSGVPKVYLFDGKEKINQKAHWAVVDIDVGQYDLQQCADAVIRLRAEYLYATQKSEQIGFHYTNGFWCHFSKWSAGYRTVVHGNKVSWVKKENPDASYSAFKEYLKNIFTYSGTYSLSREMKNKDIMQIEAGDVFIYGGFPGHAVLVIDVAVSEQGERVFLLAQSYMPAQDIHILRNPNHPQLSPWYSCKQDDNILTTPEWTFEISNLKAF